VRRVRKEVNIFDLLEEGEPAAADVKKIEKKIDFGSLIFQNAQ
jgi:hypothetical protein